MVDGPDFTLKPTFPIAGVADLYANRSFKEAQMRAQQQGQLVQGLNAFGQGVNSLVQRRIAMAQAMTMGQQLGMRPEDVQGLMPEQIESLGKIKQGQVQMDLLMRSLGVHPQGTNPAQPSYGVSNPNGATPISTDVSQNPSPSQPSPSIPMQSPVMNKVTAGMLLKLRPQPVISEREALASGSVMPGTHIVKPMTTMQDVSWETSSPQEQSLAKAMYEGRVRPYDVSFRDRGRIAVLANEYANMNGLAPFKAYAGDVNAAMGKFSTSGKMGQNALSLNTALGHTSSALDSYQAIQNTNQAWANKPINWLRKNTNDPHVVALGINMNALQGELANVFKNSGATDQEINHWRDYLNENLTPSQYMGAVGKIDELLRSRLNAMEYTRASAGGGTGQPLLSPKGKEISEKLGNEQGNLKKSSNGVTYEVLP